MTGEPVDELAAEAKRMTVSLRAAHRYEPNAIYEDSRDLVSRLRATLLDVAAERDAHRAARVDGDNEEMGAALVEARAKRDALLARLAAAEADADRLASNLCTPYPVGAYVRWSRNGNTENADTLNHYEEDRDAALRLHDAAIALRDPR